MRLTLVRRRALADSSILRLPPLVLAVDGGSNVEQPHHTSDNSVGNYDGLRWRIEANFLRILQTESTVNDTERNDDTADPEMCVGPEDPSRILLVREMVDEAQERLQEK